MKYYRYISQSKVDMLYPQVREPLAERFTLESSLRIPFFEFRGRKAKEQQTMPLVRKLDSVTAQLDREGKLKGLNKEPLSEGGWYKGTQACQGVVKWLI
jgi:hypothetical protein